MKHMLIGLGLALLLSSGTEAFAQAGPRQAAPLDRQEFGQALEQLRAASNRVLAQLLAADLASARLSLDPRALEEIEIVVGATLAELRGETSTARFRPMTPRQRLQRLQAAFQALMDTLAAGPQQPATPRPPQPDRPAQGAPVRTVTATPPAAAAARADTRVRDISAERMAAGQRLYVAHCASCHGAQGQAQIGPRLDGMPALSSARFLITTILWGVPVHGMPPFDDQLSDAEIAALATFVRNAWSNNFGEVTPEQVAGERRR